MDLEKTPIGEANVTSITQPAGALSIQGITDEDGTLTFANLPSGSCRLEIQKAGYETTNAGINVSVNQAKACTISVAKIPPLLVQMVLDPSILIITVGVIVA